LAQGGHGVYAAGATRRDEAGEESGYDQDRDGDGESRYVSGAHSLYEPIQDAACSESGKNANSDTYEDHRETLSKYQTHYI
jgi:hypothetical protein